MLIRLKKQGLLYATITLAVLWSRTIQGQDKNKLGIKHVVVIGFDGLSPDGLQHATTPTFDRLVREGASTMHARAVLPTSSSPNWASMIMGAGPEQHGITSNAWERDSFTLSAVTQRDDFLFPTIFGLIDHQYENAEIGAIYHWKGFGRLFEKGTVDIDLNPRTEEETAQKASAYIVEKKPDFTFVHFDHVDHAGHEYGHGTPQYYRSVEKADRLLAEVIASIEQAGIKEKTLVIVSADHGGLGKGHGGESLAEIEIPFIVWGKSVKKNHKIALPVYQYDNAATVAFALGVKVPQAWIGRPVKSAFEGFEIADDFPLLEQLQQPVILPGSVGYKKAGGLFDEKAEGVIKNPNKEGIIRYTSNGSMPSASAKEYDGPFQIIKNSVVKSAIFKNGKINSMVSEAFFRIKSKNAPKPVGYEVFYLKDLSFLPSLASKIPDIKGNCFEITSDEIKNRIKQNTVVRFTAQIDVNQADPFTFYLRSDDGSKLFIDGELIVDNDGDHGVREKSESIHLQRGKHGIEVLWFNGGGDGWLDIFMETPGIPKQILPTTLLKANK